MKYADFTGKIILKEKNDMTVFLCTDERGGMIFMNRRVSSDKILTKDIEKTVGDGILYISDFSEFLFEKSDISVMSVTNPLDAAEKEDFVFVENLGLKEAVKKIDRLIIYNWNRKYPFDFSLDINPIEEGFHLSERCEFKGNSHDKITKEIYEK